MNSYIDFNYYSETFKGTVIPEEKFDKFAIRASRKVKNFVLNKDITKFENDVKSATCSIAEILYNQNLNKDKLTKLLAGSEKQVSSEKVGDYSRNFTSISLIDLEKICSDEYVNKQIKLELYNYLFYTGLLYSGVPYYE